MALNLIFTINLLQDKSPYVAGDKFHVYWNDSTSAINVYVDENTEVIGANIGSLMDSGSFEAASSTWGLISTAYPPPADISRSSTYAHSGTYSGKYTVPVSGYRASRGAMGYQSATMTVGKTYRATCWVYTDVNIIGVEESTLSLRPSDELINTVLAFNNQITCTIADCSFTWVQLSVDVTVLTATSIVPLIKLFVSPYLVLTSGNSIYYDDFEIKELGGFTTSTSLIGTGPDLGVIFADGLEQWTVSNCQPYLLSTNKEKIVSLYSFCSGVDLSNFHTFTTNPPFPYAARAITVNAPACGYVAPCDIRFDGAPVIVKAANPFSSDGSFSVVAISSKSTTKYALDRTTPYASMSNTSGSFTALKAGVYEVTARDSANCLIFQSITIGAELSNNPPPGDTVIVNNPKYRMEHKDVFNGVTARVDILERGFTGSPETVKGGMPPFIRTLSNISVNNKFEPLRPTSATINLLSERDLQYIGIFSQDDRKYQVKYYKPVGTLLWTGFVIPSVFNQPYTECPPYITTITATDNLTELTTVDFLDKDGNKLSGVNSLINIISIVLSKLSLDIGIRVACAIKAFTHTSNANFALEETIMNMDSFYEDDGTPWKCDRVLKVIMPLGAKVVQENGYWNIIRVEQQTSTYTYREYDRDGEFVTTGSYNPVVEIEAPSVRMNTIFTGADAVLEVVPAYGTITVRRRLHIVSNLIKNGSFDIENFVNNQIQGWNVDLTNGTFRWNIEKIIESQTINIPAAQTTIERIIDRAQPGNFLSSIPSNFSNKQTRDFGSGSYALAISELVSPGDAGDYASVICEPFPVQFGSNDSFTFSFTYRINLQVETGNRLKENPLWVRMGWKIQVGTYFYNEKIGWTDDTDYEFNYLYVDKFGSTESFEVTTAFPPSQHGVVYLFQTTFQIYGSNFNDSPINGITTTTLPVGTKAYSDGTYSDYYTLFGGTDAESLPDIVRPLDYDGSTNPVVWKLDRRLTTDFLVDVQATYLDEVKLVFNPNNEKAPEEEILQAVINENYKENLEVEIESGDLPLASATFREIHNKQYIYDNYFRDGNGQPTSRWTRAAVPAESTSLQQIFLKSLVNQYQYPTFKVSGSLIGWNELNFLTTFKQEEEQPSQTFVNEDFTGSLTGWTNDTGGPEAWYYDAGTARSDFPDNLLRQTNNINFYAGQRIRIDFSITRSNSVGARADWLYILLRNPATVQQIVVASMEGDGTWTRSVKFTIAQDCTNIGFNISDIQGSGTCTYKMDYFRLKGLIVTRYFTVDSMEIDGKNNLYNVGLMQLVPVVPSVDPDVDDSGEGNTGTEGGAGGGTTGGGSTSGSSFSGDFNADFGGDYDNILN